MLHEGHANMASIDTRSQLDAIVITTNPCPAFYRCRVITLRYNVAMLDATCKLWLASLLRFAERSIRSFASMTDVLDGCGRSSRARVEVHGRPCRLLRSLGKGNVLLIMKPIMARTLRDNAPSRLYRHVETLHTLCSFEFRVHTYSYLQITCL